jgi:hypothetical protein
MKAAAIAALCFILAAAVVEGQVCHYDCYSVSSAGANAKEALLKQCGVTDYKVTTTDLSSTYKKGATPGCETAACGFYANEAAITNYRDNCEHVDPKYSVLRGHGTSYNAPCSTCQ